MGQKKYFKILMAPNFPNLVRNINLQIRTYQNMGRDFLKRNSSHT